MLNLQTIANLCNGKLIGNNINVANFTFNSNSMPHNGMFIALSTGKVNGHIYLQHAKQNGACSFLVEEDFLNNNKYLLLSLTNIVVVKNTYQAMLTLATYMRSNYSKSNCLIGITGSVGKTSTKEMLSVALDGNNVFKTSGNFNNHIGVPFSLLHLTNKHNYAVIEMGMSQANEIDFLSNLAKPNIAIITAIGNAHSQNFSSINQIAQAKAEIINGLSNNGSVILNYDDTFYNYLYQYSTQHNKNVVSVSVGNNNANCFVVSCCFYNYNNSFGFKVVASIFNNIVEYNIQSIYKHNILLSLFTLACAYLTNANLQTVASNLSNYSVPIGRGSCITLKNNCLLIDDSYNASYASVQAGLRALTNIQQTKVLILGEMLELGHIAKTEHEKLATDVLESQPSLVILIGNNMQYLLPKINNMVKTIYYNNVADNFNNILNTIQQNLNNNTALFIKGSYGSKTWKIAQYIREHND